LRGPDVPWRAGPRARRALRLPALPRGRIAGGRAPLRHPTPLKTTPSMSETAGRIRVRQRAGISAHEIVNIVLDRKDSRLLRGPTPVSRSAVERDACLPHASLTQWETQVFHPSAGDFGSGEEQ